MDYIQPPQNSGLVKYCTAIGPVSKHRYIFSVLDQVMDIALRTIVATMMPYTMRTAGQEALCIRNSRLSWSRVMFAS
jgi:hypothetical protein